MKKHNEIMWTMLVHFGTNFWFEEGNTHCRKENIWTAPASPTLRLDYGMLDTYLKELKAAGCNTVMIDVGDSMRYDSHPEIGVKDAMTPAEMKEKIDAIRALGMNVIPKLNFSTTHDVWLGDYARMISTPTYYKVCADIIDEVCKLFDAKFMHIGMDEEGYACQRDFDYVVVRQHDLWWHDFNFFVDCVEKNGARAMMWADLAREHFDEVSEKCRRSVVMCVWYYFKDFDSEDEYHQMRIRPLKQLSDAGFDILPSGSSCYVPDSLKYLVDYSCDHVAEEHLLGFAQTTWEGVMPEYKENLDKGTPAIAEAIETYKKKSGEI